jgi:hypothetical protein
MTQRREFLKQASLLAAGSVAAAGSLEAQAAVAAAPQAQGAWDMSWAAKVTGKYRMVYDAPEIAGGVVFHQARSFLAGYTTVFGLADSDVTAVIVARHAGVPLVLNDAIWSDAPWGEKEQLKDPVTGEITKKNPFVNIPAGATHAVTWPDGSLDKLIARGVIVLACDLALGNAAGQLANRRKIPFQDARKLVNESLIPGVIRMPSGIFATSHAQQLGCGMMYAG